MKVGVEHGRWWPMRPMRGAGVDAGGGSGEAEKFDGSGGGREEGGEDAEERALAGAVMRRGEGDGTGRRGCRG